MLTWQFLDWVRSMRLKLRTIFATVTVLSTLGVGCILSMLAMQSTIKGLQDFSRQITLEKGNAGIRSIELLLSESEDILQTMADYIERRHQAPEILDLIPRFWLDYQHNFKNKGAMVYIEAGTGKGVACDINNNTKIIRQLDDQSFEIVDSNTGVSQPIPDFRSLPFFRSGMATRKPGWTQFYAFNNKLNGQNFRGITKFIPVKDPLNKDRFIGMLGLDINMEWVSEYLKNTLAKSPVRSIAFVLERRRNGMFNLIADTEHSLNESGLDLDGDGYVDPDELGDEIMSATKMVIPKELTNDNESQVYHDTISTKQGTFYATFLCPFPGQPPHWILCFLASEEELIAPAKRRLLVHLGITGGTIIVSLFLTTWIGFSIAKPIENLSRTARNLGQLKLAREPMTKSLIHEVDELGNAIRSMHTGISSFLRYVPQDLLRRYMSSGQTATIDSELTEVTILFADVKDFTSLSEQIEPMILVRQLNEFLETISVCILEHNGTVDKYIGDAVMAFWNAPIRVPGHAREACSCVLEFSPRMAALQNKWLSEGLIPMKIRVGLHSGEAIVGNLGSSVRLNYTIIGDAVNLASRLEGLNKAYGTSNLISESTRAFAGFEFLTRPVDIVAVKGKNTSVQVHELMDWANKATEQQKELARQTSHAWNLYQQHNFIEAEAAYSTILKHFPMDGLASTMAERCKELIASPPATPWSGVYRSRNK